MARQKIAVIGSGFGGLSAAIRLQAQGFDVEIFEKRDKPGGRAYVFQQDGFTFDAGPTVVTAPDCIEDLFRVSGRPMSSYLKLLPVFPFYRLYWEDGSTFDYSGDLAYTIKQIRQRSEADAEGYKRFLKYSKDVFEHGYTDLADVPFLNFSQMVKAAPHLIRLRAHRDVYHTVARYVKDEKLREAFSFHSLLVGGNPFRSSAIYTLIHYLETKWGVTFPKGGTGALVQAFVKLFQDLGGKLHLNSELDQIQVRGGQVKGLVLKNGQTRSFDTVISNADVVHTYRHLLRQEPATASTGRKIAKMSHSMSVFLIYFGTKKRYPQLTHHNVMFGQRYKGLLKDIFDKGVLPPDFSLYLHNPTKSDTSLAPEGHEGFYALSPVAHLGKMPIDWSVEGPKYAERIMSYLEHHYLPDLRQNIVTQRIFTPDDFKNELNAHLGSAFSVEPLLTQSAYFRPHNKDHDVRGLYFAGAGTHPGAGLPGVINSGKATAGLVVKELREDLGELTRETMAAGSKSFSAAARFFRSETRLAAQFLYAWCRHCDDAVDDHQGQKARDNLGRLLDLTQRSFRMEDVPRHETAFVAFQKIVRKYGIPEQYALDLLAGMRADVEGQRYESFEELRRYCYQVAGTVGLMMSHIMGVNDPKALGHAVDLGVAFQLTNIARDVWTDAEMGRIYLPLQWLRKAGIPEKPELLSEYRESVYQLTSRLLEDAEAFYASADEGVRHLPLQAAFAVAAARSIYSEIGQLIIRGGSTGWKKRTVVPSWKKWVLSIRTAISLTPLVVSRAFRRWKRVPLTITWRYS